MQSREDVKDQNESENKSEDSNSNYKEQESETIKNIINDQLSSSKEDNE